MSKTFIKADRPGISKTATIAERVGGELVGNDSNLLTMFYVQIGVVSENGIYGHSRFCNTDFDDKLACLNLSGV
ncbi:hypothetical protein KAM644c_57880 (plasmid) [Klebsiella quasipneumoniae subsp. quasipneumoniae]|uniref:Uncharacterized protein n=1 Tax=Klebsiella quasipneumoniae subsp. quasipneumoniae TaxID=1667327 RepID=A0AAN1YAW2_9ENTR|nr:hypothetical protein KAM644c_57880 [Klebsiella quasipneumoniae subsp. quasipneumoniae]BDO22664.1 hypothetical protein KAM645c_57540 [Klebsiella quasipneumoniae subsp. quasipneumoniae]